ncbi:MAG: MFS transporter [Aristaeellaceae bacterium]
MRQSFFSTVHELRAYLLLWGTQTLSSLGSRMTSYALVIWVYGQEGSALSTALLMVASYAPYVLLSIFAGALSDRWDKRRTMLVCDALAAACTVTILILLRADALRIGHLYLLNVLSGLMNTVQQPASEIATSALLPREHYQRVGGLRYLSSAVNGMLTPILATALMGLAGMEAVIFFDLATFAAAFVMLWKVIRLPDIPRQEAENESLLQSAKAGLRWLKRNRGVMDLMLFLAAINLVASMYDAAFPAMMLSREGGSQQVMGLVNSCIGAAMLLGSILASVMKMPRSRVRVVCNTLLFSMATENICLALGRNAAVWCVGGFLGWIVIPAMNANLDATMRLNIPLDMQGRVFAARNSLQFFTIPVGYFLGGWLVDCAFEPLMAAQGPGSVLIRLFGGGKGSGAACFFAVLWVLGLMVSLLFRKDPAIWALENQPGDMKGADA